MASKDAPLNESQIKEAAVYVETNFFKPKDPKEDMAALRERRMIDMHSLVIGYLFRCGYSIPRALQAADYMREKELFPPEPAVAALASDDE